MLVEPRKALNKAFLKIKPNRIGIELFKQIFLSRLSTEFAVKFILTDQSQSTYHSKFGQRTVRKAFLTD